MNRRTFLRSSAAMGAAIAGGTLAVTPLAAGITDLSGRRLRRAPLLGAFDLEETTVAELQRRMSSGELTARAVAEQYLARIESVDRRGPTLRSVIETNPEALDIADALDAERRAGGGRVRGPLHGIPILLKDNIDTADRMGTTAGSLALVGAPVSRDAFIVARLREAGAVVLGKTNLSEWANFRSTKSTSGWSAVGGQTRNPYALDRNPCGSSSGSGAAIAANLAVVAVGTETDGSIVCPATSCGLVGLKPTLGLVSRSGIVPIAHSQDTAGPMARTVADAAALLTVLAAVDDRDRITMGSRAKAKPDYTAFLDAAGLKGARIGVARNFFGFNRAVDGVMEDAIRAMREAGAVIVDPARLPNKGRYDDSEFEVLLYEFKADLEQYLATRPGAPATLAKLIEFNGANREKELPYFGQEIFEMAVKKGPLTTPAYRAALARNHRLSRAQGIDLVLRSHRLDAYIAPTGGPAWPTDLLNGDHYTGGSSTAAAVAGYPSITVPAGFVHGLPVGVSFVAGAWAEPALIRLAYAFEQATKVRKPPRFLVSAEII